MVFIVAMAARASSRDPCVAALSSLAQVCNAFHRSRVKFQFRPIPKKILKHILCTNMCRIIILKPNSVIS